MARKRTPGAKRTASGRKSRAHDAYTENLEPILTRMRLFGLSEVDARDQKASTFIGRLQLTKAISQAQYDAAQEYLSVYEAFQRAVKSPDALRSSSGGGDQGESPTYANWCRGAIARKEAADKAIMTEQCLYDNRGRNLFAACVALTPGGVPKFLDHKLFPLSIVTQAQAAIASQPGSDELH